MGKILKKLSTLALTFALFINFSGAVYANEKTENQKESRAIDNHISLLTDQYSSGRQVTVPFYFENQGNTYFKLKPSINLPDPNKARLSSDFTLKVFDENNNFIQQVNTKGQIYNMDVIISEMYKLNLKYGYSIQLINHLNNRPDTIKITGNILSNYKNHNYSASLPTNISNQVVFRLTPEGLRSQPTNQVKNLSGVYRIHSVQNNKVVRTRYNQVSVVDASDISDSTTWDFYMNPDTGAYKLISPEESFYEPMLSWEKRLNSNNVGTVSMYESDTENWLIEDIGRSSEGIYKISNYDDPSKILNLDSNGVNISVADDRNNNYQRFKLVRKY